MGFLTGTKGGYKELSTIGKDQMPLKSQLVNAGQRQGAGGAFGDAADYYRSLLSDNNDTFNSLANPEMRRFNEQIIPELGEQFAGMGFGGSGLSGSGFRNAAVNAGTDLSERLGAIRANLRQQGAAGLAGIGQQGLQSFHQNVYNPGTPGLLEGLAPLAGSALGVLGAPAGAAAGGALSNFIGGKTGWWGKT